jgi:hypothetical protein
MRIGMASMLALAGLAMAFGARPSAADQAQLLQIYNTIKARESQFPLPQPQAEVNVGSFDTASGEFTGLKSSFHFELDPIFHKPRKIIDPVHTSVNAVAISLRFAAQNGPVTYTVTPRFARTGPGSTVTVVVPAFQSRTVAIGAASDVQWSANGAGRTYSDTLFFDRPKIVGVGAFTIPALPVALVYEPPTLGGGSSSQTYSQEFTVGTAVRMELSQENSTTVPGTASKFAGLEDLKTGMQAVATAIQLGAKLAPNVPKEIATALNFIAGQLGSASASDTSGTVHTQVSEQELKVTLKRTLSPNSHLGPGKGDIISVLANARLVWMAEDGELTLALLGFDSIKTFAVQDMITNPAQTGLDAATIQELLKLDPFVAGGPSSALPSPRFVFDHSETLSNVRETITLSHTMTQTDLNATTNIQIHTEDYQKGALSFLGLGVDETKQVMSKITHSNSTAVSVGTTTTVEIVLDVVGSVDLNFSYDRIFGTFTVTKRLHVPPTKGIFVSPGNLVFAR